MSATTAAKPTTARDVTAMLKRHYLPDGKSPGGIFAPEIGSPDGARRADLIWAPTTAASGNDSLHGHEIKVSRADVLGELQDPAKCDPWLRFCTRWWLVLSDPALIDGLEIPEAWGIMAPPSGRRTRSMTVLRPAPLLTPLAQGPAFRRIATWQLYKHSDELVRAQGDARWKDQRIANLEEAAQNRTAHASPHMDKLAKLYRRALEVRGDGDTGWWHIDDEVFVDTLRDVGNAQAAAREVRRVLADALRGVDRLTETMTLSTARALLKRHHGEVSEAAAALPGSAVDL